jgi:hypothetical protein
VPIGLATPAGFGHNKGWSIVGVVPRGPGKGAAGACFGRGFPGKGESREQRNGIVQFSGRRQAGEGVRVIAACVVCLAGAGWVAGQTIEPEVDWVKRESLPGASVTDVAVAIEHWRDPATDERWVFVTGYHQTPSGATVMATYRYDATHEGPEPPDPAVDPAYYPEDWQNAVGDHRAVAMAVDGATGDVYITGRSQNPQTGLYDYATIKYDKNLVRSPTWPGSEIGVRRWDSGGHDFPADLAFNGNDGRLAVTGTSNGFGTGNDIVTLLYNSNTGEPAWPVHSSYPECNQFYLVQRWNNPIITNSPDTAAKVRLVTIASTSGNLCSSGVGVIVAGTTWNGEENGYDFVTLVYDQFGHLFQAAPLFYNGPAGGDDFCKDLSWFEDQSLIIVAGTSQHHWSAFPPAVNFTSTPDPPSNTDYAIVTYQINGPKGYCQELWMSL